jgi:pimeloyl-ACP methyl ester carboxylesterase
MQSATIIQSLRPRPHPKRILFIPSLHFTSGCWDAWLLYYRAIGYVCHAPSWPHLVGDSGPGKMCPPSRQPLTLAEIVEMYIYIIQEEISEPPIIIGHGTGAMIAQILASLGLAVHCVCLAARPANTFPNYRRLWSFFLYRALKKSSVTIPSFRTFHRYYANTSTTRRAQALYEKHLIPEPTKTIRNFGHLPSYYVSNAMSPVLFISGERDKVASPKAAQRNFDKYYSDRYRNLHRILQDFDHMSFFQERYIPDIAMLINAWLSIQESETFYLPGSYTGN